MATSTINYMQETVANEILSRFPEAIKFKAQNSGTFAGVVKEKEMWLFGVQRITLGSSALYLVHRYNGQMNVSTIKQDSNYTVATNNQGTVEMSYSNSPNNVYAFAIRLYSE